MKRFLIEALKNIILRYKTYRIHGLSLPEGVKILYPDNVTIGRDFLISPYCYLICQDSHFGSELAIGNRVALNYMVHINADNGGRIKIGNNVIIGPNSILRASNHRFDRTNIPMRDQAKTPGYITVEDDVWIGAGVVVLPNVTIGKGSVIGAGSVVTKDIPAFSVAVGNPADVIKNRKDMAVADTGKFG